MRTLDDRAYRHYLQEHFGQQAERLRLNADDRAAEAVIALLKKRAKL
jgi:hypothetical protein